MTGGAGGVGTSLAHVCLSRTPVIGTPARVCQETSAAKVCGPNFPSGVSRRAFCATAICAFCWPMTYTGYGEAGATGRLVGQAAVRGTMYNGAYWPA